MAFSFQGTLCGCDHLTSSINNRHFTSCQRYNIKAHGRFIHVVTENFLTLKHKFMGVIENTKNLAISLAYYIVICLFFLFRNLISKRFHHTKCTKIEDNGNDILITLTM